jgi:ketosteroid isomerase-like protein
MEQVVISAVGLGSDQRLKMRPGSAEEGRYTSTQNLGGGYMTEEQMKKTMRDLATALSAKDVEKTLSFFSEDGSWTTPEGTFKGKGELKRYIGWQTQMSPDFRVTDTGIKTMAQGNTGVYEHVFSGTFKGRKWQTLALCVYEFSGDKILNVRSVYDRLSMAKQVSKGMIEKSVVNSLVKAMEKGLR